MQSRSRCVFLLRATCARAHATAPPAALSHAADVPPRPCLPCVQIPITATLKTISQIIEEHDVSVINLLKVDVEGLEMQVLEGIQTEAHWEMVQQVVMEVEDYELLTRITELLETQGFDVQVRKGLEMEEHGAASSEVTHLWARRL